MLEEFLNEIKRVRLEEEVLSVVGEKKVKQSEIPVFVDQIPVMPDAATCAVCTIVTAKYKCPTCDIPYCGVKCFTGHNDGACNEDFCERQVTQHLLNKRVEYKDKKSMHDILLK